jgi:hypothetical protein
MKQAECEIEKRQPFHGYYLHIQIDISEQRMSEKENRSNYEIQEHSGYGQKNLM